MQSKLDSAGVVRTHICHDEPFGNGNAQREKDRLIAFNGKKKTAVQWARSLGITKQAFHSRLQRLPFDHAFQPKKKALEQRRKAACAANAKRSPGLRSELARKAALAMNAKRSPERRLEIGLKAGAASKASKTPAQRSAGARHAARARWGRRGR